MNALKHGMTAHVPVLPGEDPEAFHQRVEGIVDSLAPRNALELALAEQAALSLWKIERAERAEAARAAAALRAAEDQAEARRREELHALGRWLLAKSVQAKRETAEALLPFLPEDRHAPFKAGRGEPLTILLRIQGTADGCQWLLWRWDRLRDRLEGNGGWDLEEMIEAAQLRGERPLHVETAEWEGLLQARYARDTANLEEGRRQLLDQLTDGPAADRAGIAAALLGLVGEETARLEELEAARRESEATDRCELADRLAVDPTREGEQVQRYQLNYDRKLHRAIQGLLKLRREDGVAADPGAEGVPDPAGPVEPSDGLAPAPADVPMTVPIPPGAVEPPDGLAPLATDVPVTASGPVDPDIGLSPTATDLSAIATATAGAIEPGDAMTPGRKDVTYEPDAPMSGSTVGHRDALAGASGLYRVDANPRCRRDREGGQEAAGDAPVPTAAAAADCEPVRANEPTSPTSGEPIRRNEPGPAVGGDGDSPNEPTESGRIAQPTGYPAMFPFDSRYLNGTGALNRASNV